MLSRRDHCIFLGSSEEEDSGKSVRSNSLNATQNTPRSMSAPQVDTRGLCPSLPYKRNMSEPEYVRTASTNLSKTGSSRVLDGKFGIITGAARGIGAAISENLAQKGCSLLLNYTSDSSAEITSQLAIRLQTNYGVQCHIVQADMGSENGPAHIIETAVNHFSHPKTRNLQIDILINNAGIGGKHALGEGTAAEFSRFYNVNVRGPLFLVQAAMPYLPHDRSGRIVNLSSVSASCGFAGDGIYGGTKAAVEAMTRTWARELAERATVNAVNPGPVATKMYADTSEEFQRSMSHWTRNTPLAGIRPDIDRKDLVEGAENAGGRPGYDTEVAGVVAMLCTPDSAWCTGSVVCANGGMKFTV
nr:l-xylulose reductase [Quercus suber]